MHQHINSVNQVSEGYSKFKKEDSKQQGKKYGIGEPILATVNINMGEHCQKPKLIIRQSTNVAELVIEFIKEYQLPFQTYDVIFKTIEEQLKRQGININQLGIKRKDSITNFKKEKQIYDDSMKFSFAGQNNYDYEQKENIDNKLFKSKVVKPTLQIKEDKTQKNTKKILSKTNKINFQSTNQLPKNQVDNKRQRSISIKHVKKNISPIRMPLYNLRKDKSDNIIKEKPIQNKQRTKTPLRIRQQLSSKTQKLNKQERPSTSRITLTKTQTPTRHSLITTSKQKHKKQSKQHQKQKKFEKYITQIYKKLTSHQPQNIQTLCPQYINFQNIHPQILVILQQFFELLHQTEFGIMNQEYFSHRIKELGMADKIIKVIRNGNQEHIRREDEKVSFF